MTVSLLKEQFNTDIIKYIMKYEGVRDAFLENPKNDAASRLSAHRVYPLLKEHYQVLREIADRMRAEGVAMDPAFCGRFQLINEEQKEIESYEREYRRCNHTFNLMAERLMGENQPSADSLIKLREIATRIGEIAQKIEDFFPIHYQEREREINHVLNVIEPRMQPKEIVFDQGNLRGAIGSFLSLKEASQTATAAQKFNKLNKEKLAHTLLEIKEEIALVERVLKTSLSDLEKDLEKACQSPAFNKRIPFLNGCISTLIDQLRAITLLREHVDFKVPADQNEAEELERDILKLKDNFTMLFHTSLLYLTGADASLGDMLDDLNILEKAKQVLDDSHIPLLRSPITNEIDKNLLFKITIYVAQFEQNRKDIQELNPEIIRDVYLISDAAIRNQALDKLKPILFQRYGEIEAVRRIALFQHS